MGEPVYQYERKIYKNETDNNFMKKDKKENDFMNIQKNDSTNVAFRKKENVVDGNEFKTFSKNDIKWD